MSLHELPKLADQIPGFEKLIESLDSTGATFEIEGLTGTARGYVLSRVFARLNRPVVIVTYQHEQAQRLANDLTRFGVSEQIVRVLPSAQSLFIEGDVTDYRTIGERISALELLQKGVPCIVIGTAEAVLQRTSPPKQLFENTFILTANETVDFDEVARKLLLMGYEGVNTVTRPGEFSRRGGILDLFPSSSENPVRIELFGDEIETIRPFDVASQRSIGKEAFVEIAPAREVLLTPEAIKPALRRILATYDARKAAFTQSKTNESRDALERLTTRIEKDLGSIQQETYFDGLEQYLPYLLPLPICALDYLPQKSLIVLDDARQVKEHWGRITMEVHSARERKWERGEALDAERFSCPYETLIKAVANKPALLLNLTSQHAENIVVHSKMLVNSAQTDAYRGRLPTLGDDIGTWLDNDCRVVIVSDQPHRVREILEEMRLKVQIRDAKVGSKPGLFVMEGRLRAGFKISDTRFYLLTDAELFGSSRQITPRRKVAGGVAISSVLDLKVNDFVVHIHHGIGVYRGMVKRKVEGANLRDYILVEYQGADKLFIPADQIDRIQRYSGTDGATPQVNKIGGQEWQRATRKVKEQAKEMAGELIRLYAARQASQRTPYGEDTIWQQEMEDAFPYSETPAQLRAINDVKADLERQQPMDRLICGDVGFGKTEIALRAAFKVVTEGKQVAVLCPTTVLAAQHLSTFTERLAAYPMRIELLSRYRSKQEQAKTCEELKGGFVDIVIGTHRLLSKDITFKNLGMVVVDEEQRFGVGHKERLKQLRTQVDVLTLSATPIPRTLSMAISGLRDMSVISDPPEGRTPVQTFVRDYDDDLIRDSILRELERDGQIYFVHNKVESIYHVAEHLRRLVPDARIGVGHGQMSEDQLEKVMYEFYHQEHDILLCTTIIENGLDVSNANTIIIDNADHLGLSQLYQLRGRVGRSTRQAYCYLFYRRNKQLSEVAEKRLEAMREFSALGSGYKVAMRDLEIRGAGNLLGAEQSGAMISVGFDLYCQLLGQAVKEMQGEEVSEDILPPMDLAVTAHIPPEYIPGEAERIYFYKRMSNVRAVKDVEALQEEFEDRFGDPPTPVWTALAILRLRLRCKEIGVASVKGEGVNIAIKFTPRVRLSPDSVRLLTYAFKGGRFTSDGVVIPLSGVKVLPQIEEMMSVLEKALAAGKK